MKHKKLIIFCFLLSVIYLIYILFHNDKINYLSIGDSLSLGINSYNEESYGYSDYLANYLKENQRKKEIISKNTVIYDDEKSCRK